MSTISCTTPPAQKSPTSLKESKGEKTVQSVLKRLHKALQSETPDAVKLSVLIGQLYELNEQGRCTANLETTPDFIQIMDRIREKQTAGKMRTFVVPKPEAVIEFESVEKVDASVADMCPPMKRIKIEDLSTDSKLEESKGKRDQKIDEKSSSPCLLRKLLGCHCSQKLIWRENGHRKRRTLSLLDSLNNFQERSYTLSFVFGDLCRERVEVLTKSAKPQKRSLAFCGTILYGLALMEAREKLENDPTLTKKKRLNAFSNLQRRDRYGSFCGRLRETFMERTGLEDRSEMAAFEQACDVTILLFNSAGFLTYISSKLRSKTAWFLLDEKSSDLYLVTNQKGLCRVDLPHDRRTDTIGDGIGGRPRIL